MADPNPIVRPTALEVRLMLQTFTPEDSFCFTCDTDAERTAFDLPCDTSGADVVQSTTNNLQRDEKEARDLLLEELKASMRKLAAAQEAMSKSFAMTEETETSHAEGYVSEEQWLHRKNAA